MKAFAFPACFLRNLLPLFLLAACSDSGPSEAQWSDLQKSREALQIENGRLRDQATADAERIRILQEEIRLKNKDWAERSGKTGEESRARLESIQTLQAENSALKTALETQRRDEKVAARTEAKGGTLPQLKTRDGSTYNNVTIRNVVPDGIHILHETGATKILFTNLDPSWGDRFGYNTREAEAYAREEDAKKAAAQKAQWETIAARQQEETDNLKNKKTAYGKKLKEQESEGAARLKTLRSELYNELRALNSQAKGNLGSISRSEPENSAAFNNNLLALRMGYARDLRAQINELKYRLGSY